MKVKQHDIMHLTLIGGLSKKNQSEIAQVIELFKDRKIERFDTARNLIHSLSSQGKKQQSVAKDKVKFYDEHYLSRKDQYDKKVKPPSSNSYKSPKKEFFVQGHLKVLTTYSKTYKGKKTEYDKDYESLEPVKKVVVARSSTEAKQIFKDSIVNDYVAELCSRTWCGGTHIRRLENNPCCRCFHR